ncbi:PIG-L family deacetylase, partial [Psychrobacter sp. 16-Bac2893]
MATVISNKVIKLINKDVAVTHVDTLEGNHPIVGDRVIEGDGTSQDAWKNWLGLQDMPRFDIAKSFAPHQRVCIFAPHPDDEVLGCGGLLQQLAANGNPIVLIHVTNGTQSHPNSHVYSQEKLNIIRPQESIKALEVLSVAHQVTTVALDLTDGNVFA